MNRIGEASASARPRRTLLAALLIVACGLAAYSNSFTELFAGLDGKESIRDNPHIRHIWPPSEALSLPLWKPPYNLAETPTVARRPTFSLSLALTNHFLGFEPWAHHAVNLAIHIAAALALFGVVRRTSRLQRPREPSSTRSTWLALATALIWLVHPLQTESVTYIVQRTESLMGLLFLLTVYCALRAVDGRHRIGWQAGAVVACLVGAGSKQTIAVVPFLVLLHDYTFVSSSRKKWARPVFYVALAAAAWLPPLTYARKIAEYVDLERTLSYALAQPAVILHYLRLSLWPDDLFLYVNTSLFDVHSAAQVVIPAAVLLVLLAATVYAIARRHWLGFIGGWFFATLGPVSSFIPISDVIQEHRMYLPLAALAVLSVIAGRWAVHHLARGLSPRGQAAAGVLLLTVVVGGLGIRTYVRNWDYHHEFTMIHPADLYEDYTILADHYLSKDGLIQAEAKDAGAMLHSPDRDARDVPFAHFILGLAYARSGEPQEAARELERVVALEPGFAYAHYHLAEVLRGRGDLSGAIHHYEEAIRIEPSLVYAHKGLALALKKSGDTTGAEKRLRLALHIDPGFAEGHYELGILALKRGDREAAAEHFRSAVHARPDLAEAHYELAVAERKLGDPDAARKDFLRALELKPDYPAAHTELGLLLRQLGKNEQARAHFAAAIDLAPTFAEAHRQLGLLLSDQGELESAAEHLAEATRLRPDWPEAHHELGLVLSEQRDLAGAAKQFEKAISLRPGFAAARHELELLRRGPEDAPKPAGKPPFERGIAALERDDLEAAVAYFEQAIGEGSDVVKAHYKLGAIRMEQGEAAAASEHFRAVVRLQPDFAEGHADLGMALFDQGDLTGAAEHLTEAIRLRPDFAGAYKGLGIVRSAQGDRQAAAEQFEEAIRLRPDFPDAHYELGILRRDQGDLERAIEQLTTAVRLRPDFAQAHLDLGQALREQGEAERAAEHLRRAAALDPNLVERRDREQSAAED